MTTIQKATFAAGCFWRPQELFEKLKGVVETSVGYTGGTKDNPSYEEVCTGQTGHAEAVEVLFDPSKISYEALLDQFWHMHNPTTKDRQGLDIGPQYRSAIFYHSQDQAEAASRSKTDLEKAKQLTVVTEIIPATHFWRAEEYHQHYIRKRS